MDTISEVDFYVVEHKHAFFNLCNNLGIVVSKPVIEWRNELPNSKDLTNKICNFLLDGKSAALLSSEGMPMIHDPGWELIREVIKRNIQLTCVPGPTSLITALVLSGLDTYRFTFESDIPDLKNERIDFFKSLKNEYKTMIFFTTEHGCTTLDALEDMSLIFGKSRLASISIGLTLENEKTFRGTINELYETFKNMEYQFNQVIVVDGYRP